MSMIGPTAPGTTQTVYPTSSLKFTKSASVATITVLILPANPLRRGLVLYNNGANSVYLTLGPIGGAGQPNGSASECAYIVATFATLTLPVGSICWTGEIYAVRNAGTGQINCYELQATS